MRVLTLILALLVPHIATGQFLCETACTVKVNTPVTIVAPTLPGAASYRLALNGQPTTLTPTVANGVVAFVYPIGFGAAQTNYFVVTALTSTGAVVSTSDPNILTVTPAPTWPCTIPSNVGAYFDGSKRYTLRCPNTTPFVRGNAVTVSP